MGDKPLTRAPAAVPVILFALAAAAVIAWALRDHARFLPTGAFVPRHALAATGHHQTAYLPPPPVTGSAVVNYPGLIMLATHLTAVVIVGSAWLVRRYFRSPDQLSARFSFAVLGSVASAVVTVPVAAITLGNAILFTGTVAAAMTVLQYTFVLVVAGTALFGVP
nr:hypothetical protein [Kibdelosporangium sp. MJ126-NF4]CEL17250.1 hypothetical protein [Kibdelosporangium sp. MJ126-NF4]CTQ91520.1 hypothetical protein [Kibdelosporangium sp. MJ126-NF4]